MRAHRLLLLSALLPACGHEKIELVTGASCKDRPEQEACALPVWPNEHSQANSDRWLSAHHDALRDLRPRVLVLDFHNARSLEQVNRVAERQIEALAEGSRYHGFKDESAPAMLHYQLLGVVDLRDAMPPRNWSFPSSSRVPLDSAGRFDLAALFSAEFAPLYGYSDEAGAPLSLCSLFERGEINELWVAVGDDAEGREPPSMVECKARYDERNERVSGNLVGTANSSYCRQIPSCGTTVRIAHLSPVRDVGCDLLVRGWAISGSVRAVPYLASNARGYFEQCGDAELPPNARERWDYENRMPVSANCEHYGLRDGPDGRDLRHNYSFDTVAALAPRYPDCGGWWQIYWRQNMPGLDNRALAEDGTPMKNWWPFLFY